MKRKEQIRKLKAFLQNNYPNIQAFDTRNTAGDYMDTVYEDGDITVDFCEDWDYIEIFGLTDSEYESLIKKDTLHNLKTFRVKKTKKEEK